VWRRLVTGAAIFVISSLSLGPAMAADAPAVVAQATVGTISGTVTTAGGAVLSGATITLSGPAKITLTSDAAGTFSVAVPAGVYTVEATKTGFQASSIASLAVPVGATVPLTVTLSALDLSTLRVIGSVTSGRGGIAINTGGAAQSIVGAKAFTDYAAPQINDVLQHIPDVQIQKLSSQQDTSIVVGGMQPYETQVLIDGHPIALGQYGVWFSQYYPSFLTGSVETQTGPGNTSTYANLAVGGTANIKTPDFTTKTIASFTEGYDNWQSQQYNGQVSGMVGDKFSYVLAAGYSGNNNYFHDKTACDSYEPSPSATFAGLGPGANQAGFSGIVSFCAPFGSAFFNKGMVEKIKYAFSPSTEVEMGFVGSYGGYNPQDSNWGESLGQMTVVDCLPGTQQCTNPAYDNLIGKTINASFWYPGTHIFNNQQIWTGQLRTTIGNNTLLVRPYIGSIQPETYDAGGEWYYPAFYSPNATYPACPPPATFPTFTCYAGPQTYPPGTQVPPNPPGNDYFGAPLPGGNSFETNACGALTSTAAYSVVGPNGQETTVDGRQLCSQYPYDTFELDTLYGSTVSFIHPMGDGFLSATYDYHGSSTYAYVNSPQNVVVPQNSAVRFSTFSLTGDLMPLKSVSIPFGIYDTIWTASGAVLNNNPLLNLCPGAAAGDNSTCGLQRLQAFIDPHIAFVWHPHPSDAMRLAFGTSTTDPFIGDLSGAPAFQPPAAGFDAGLDTFKTPGLLPEHSIAYSLGADHRFKNGSLLSLDLSDTVVHNVFQQISGEFCFAPFVCEGTFTPVNVASLVTKIATLKYGYAPFRGLGYNVAVTADSSITNGVPASDMDGIPFTLPANGVQVCGTGFFTPGSATCIPYLKGYGQVTYTSAGMFTALGMDYEGKNNAYYQPPFAIFDLTLRKTFHHIFDVQFSVQNLLNTNSFSYLPAPNLGVPLVANYTLDGTTVQQGTYPSFLIPAVTRTARLQVRVHLGD
jgi:hypothetical protein